MASEREQNVDDGSDQMDENLANKTNLIVNYLPQSLTDEEFHDIFAAVGKVKKSKIIRNWTNNYSHGYGFVEYETPTEAQAAIDSLNGLPLQHKTIKVALARPPGTRSLNTNLYVQGVPASMTKESLEEIFQAYGQIVQVKVLLKSDMTAKGDGFVLFATEEAAKSALADLQGQTLPGGNKPMNIKFAMENKRQPAPQPTPGAKYPPPPPPVGRGRGAPSFGGPGPMRTRGAVQQQRFNPMQQRGARGGFRGGRGQWRGGANNGFSQEQGYAGEQYGGFGDDGYGGEGAYGDDGYGVGGYDEGYSGEQTGGFEPTYEEAYDESYGAGDDAYYEEGQEGSGFQEYPENGYQGYYDAISFQGYQMPGQPSRGRGVRGAGMVARGAPRGVAPPRGGVPPRGAPRGAPRGLPPAAPRGAPRGGRGGGPVTYAAPSAGNVALYVYNIGPNASDDDVMTIFSHYGSVVKVDVIMDYDKNVTKNYAFVHMSTQEEADTAISALNERYCMRPNHPMQVRFHEPKGKKQ